jgi:hypothetical protein
LKELTLTGLDFDVSDVGIFYGLGFRDLRKLEIHLGSHVIG